MVKETYILWTGKSTDGISKYQSTGSTYEELYYNIQEKYGWDNVISYNGYDMKLLEVNGIDTEEFGVTSNGITDVEKYHHFLNRDDIIPLQDYHYREIIEESNGNAFYQKFEREYVVTLIHGTNSEEYFGTPNKIIEQILEFLHNLNIDFENAYIKDYEELFEDVYTRKYEELEEYLSYIENANDTVAESRNELVKDLQEIVDKSNSTILFE